MSVATLQAQGYRQATHDDIIEMTRVANNNPWKVIFYDRLNGREFPLMYIARGPFTCSEISVGGVCVMGGLDAVMNRPARLRITRAGVVEFMDAIHLNTWTPFGSGSFAVYIPR